MSHDPEKSRHAVPGKRSPAFFRLFSFAVSFGALCWNEVRNQCFARELRLHAQVAGVASGNAVLAPLIAGQIEWAG